MCQVSCFDPMRPLQGMNCCIDLTKHFAGRESDNRSPAPLEQNYAPKVRMKISPALQKQLQLAQPLSKH